MAISKGYRFTIAFDEAFPLGLVMVGEVAPDNEYQSREDKASGRPTRQRVDEVTGKRQWKATVTDPSETNSKRASYDVTFLADVQPVPTTAEVLPGMRPVELEGLTAEPKVAGNGEFKYQSYLFRATGFKAAASGGGAKPSRASGSANSGESTAKAA
jgi:translation initiation factor 2 beta subunit (eIF-2beta)/eIF-5